MRVRVHPTPPLRLKRWVCVRACVQERAALTVARACARARVCACARSSMCVRVRGSVCARARNSRLCVRVYVSDVRLSVCVTALAVCVSFSVVLLSIPISSSYKRHSVVVAAVRTPFCV